MQKTFNGLYYLKDIREIYKKGIQVPQMCLIVVKEELENEKLSNRK